MESLNVLLLKRCAHYRNNSDNTRMNKMHRCNARSLGKGLVNRIGRRSSPYIVRRALRDVETYCDEVSNIMGTDKGRLSAGSPEHNYSCGALKKLKQAIEKLTKTIKHLPPHLPSYATDKEKQERVKLHSRIIATYDKCQELSTKEAKNIINLFAGIGLPKDFKVAREELKAVFEGYTDKMAKNI